MAFTLAEAASLDIPAAGCYTCIAPEEPMLAIRLPPELEQRLEALARRTGRSKSYYVREAIVEYMDDLEDLYLAERRLEDLRAGRSDAVAIAELMQRYGVED
jgi:RHH-type rel operon transcriptional repressor/antitoxin RelB